MLIISLHIVDPMLSPLYLQWSDFDLFPSREFKSRITPKRQEYQGLTIGYLPFNA